MNAKHLPVGTKIWTSRQQKEPMVVTESEDQDWGINLNGGISVDFPYSKYQTDAGKEIYDSVIYAYQLPGDEEEDDGDFEEDEPEERTGLARWLFGK